MQLYIGNKNYSSWSLRPWILLHHLGLRFTETIVPLDTTRFRNEIGKASPTGRVPALDHDGLKVWDSLAICEYACEIAGRGWPEDRALRAQARSAAAEMHSGFAAMRTQWPMNARATGRRTPPTPELERDVGRIDAIWNALRAAAPITAGPWLCGTYSVADAMFAPVVLRFATYGARPRLSVLSQSYLDSALADPHLVAWIDAARAETWTLEKSEVGR